MATIWCPMCFIHSTVSEWEDATRTYGEENDIKGGYGGNDGILICPSCKSEVDVMRLEVDND